MALERVPIPKIAQTALTLARQDFQDVVAQLNAQTLEAMGLRSADGWSVQFLDGFVIRNVPDEPAVPTPDISPPAPPDISPPPPELPNA